MPKKEVKPFDPNVTTPKDVISPSTGQRIAYNQWVKQRMAKEENPNIPAIEDWIRTNK